MEETLLCGRFGTLAFKFMLSFKTAYIFLLDSSFSLNLLCIIKLFSPSEEWMFLICPFILNGIYTADTVKKIRLRSILSSLCSILFLIYIVHSDPIWFCSGLFHQKVVFTIWVISTLSLNKGHFRSTAVVAHKTGSGATSNISTVVLNCTKIICKVLICYVSKKELF